MKNEIKPQSIKYQSESEIFTALAIRINDAFYEITEGKHKGNLVHIWSLRK